MAFDAAPKLNPNFETIAGSPHPVAKSHPPMSMAVWSQDGTLLGWRDGMNGEFTAVARYWPKAVREAANRRATEQLLGADFMRAVDRKARGL